MMSCVNKVMPSLKVGTSVTFFALLASFLVIMPLNDVRTKSDFILCTYFISQ